MPFEFPTPTAVTLRHCNLREEKHGEDSAPAIDLKFTRQASNEILDLFHPKLRESLYWRDGDTEAQADVPGVAKVLPNKLFNAMQPIAWDLELTGCTVVIDYGLGDGSNITLADCKVNAFRIDPKEGGTVDVTFRVQTSNFPDGALDKLAHKLGQETQITISAPAVKQEQAQGELIDGTTGHPAAKKPPEDKGRAATDAFVEAGA
jgi:hypothetical protein